MRQTPKHAAAKMMRFTGIPYNESSCSDSPFRTRRTRRLTLIVAAENPFQRIALALSAVPIP
jgi:hypothetical protein